MIEPFLKWVGGKRWLPSRYPHLFPNKFGAYIEPFLGGGAIFFYMRPKRAILSDSNAELINAYRMIKKHRFSIDRTLRRYHTLHSKSFYYLMRSRQPQSTIGKAARFLYLNRVCFNGIYRVNTKGTFNVPIGSKSEVAFPAKYLLEVSNRLSKTRLLACDFEHTIKLAGKDDFVYVDPPYTVMHNNNNFVKYNDILFSWQDQIRLSLAVRSASSRGALVLISNADHPSIRELYSGFGCHHIVERASVLAGYTEARRPTTELAITNYKIHR